MLGRLADYSWFSKPQDPAPQENLIDHRTAGIIAELAKRLLGNCPLVAGNSEMEKPPLKGSFGRGRPGEDRSLRFHILNGIRPYL